MGCCSSTALSFVDQLKETSANLDGASNLQKTINRQTLRKSDNHLSPDFSANQRPQTHFRGLNLMGTKSICNKSSFVMDRIAVLNSLYRMDSAIGEGSFGKVTRATNKKTGQLCAIKTIRYDGFSLEKVEALFREVDILKELVRTRQDHPYIIKIYQVIHEDSQLHIVTELCTGGELIELLIQKGTLSEVEAAEYMFQIISAVNYLHLNNIVHRDIKPENLLLTSTSPNSSLKLIDFGTSLICDPLKKLSQVAGTPYYIAPEILKGTYDEKCDIWSCGVILYMMLSGTIPFQGEDREELFSNILLGTFTTEGKAWREVSQKAKDLVHLMLTFDPSARPSAKAVLGNQWIKNRDACSRSPRPVFALKSMKNIARFHVIYS